MIGSAWRMVWDVEERAMKKVPIDSSTISENVRAVLMKFVQRAQQQGYDDAYIEMVINRIIATDTDNLKHLLQQGQGQRASTVK